MNITQCKQCMYHISEFFGSILCRYKSYPRLFTCIEADEMKNSVPCPKEGANSRHAEEYKIGS